MHVELAPGWALDLERGPDWLFIRLRPPRHGDTAQAELAEALWQKMDQSFSHRVVLEMDDLWLLRSWMIGELVKLHTRLSQHGGMLRLCGLSEDNQEVLRQCRLEASFPNYRNRNEAVMGYRPAQPR
jgi:anti-anti-sigma factor